MYGLWMTILAEPLRYGNSLSTIEYGSYWLAMTRASYWPAYRSSRVLFNASMAAFRLCKRFFCLSDFTSSGETSAGAVTGT